MQSLSKFGAKITERETKKKYYFRDHGLLSLFLAEPESALLETVVFNQLRKKYRENIFYLRNNYEIDFYIPGKAIIQVAFSLADEQTRKRELNSIQKVAEKHEIEKLQLITWSEEEKVSMNNLAIHVLPVWKWLLDDELTADPGKKP